MRIGLVTPSWPGGKTANGIATAVAYLAAGLTEAGHEITVIPHEVSNAGPEVINLPPARAWTLTEKLATRFGARPPVMRIWADQMIAAAKQAVETRQIEALIVEESHGIAGFIQEKVSIPVIMTLHGPHALHVDLHATDHSPADSKMRIENEERAYSLCAGITSPSKDVLDRMVAKYGPPPCPAEVIANPILSAAPLTEADIRTNIKNLLFVGRYDLHKGGDTVIRAFAKIAAKDPEVTLTFIGPDPGVLLPNGTVEHIGSVLAALPQDVRARIDYCGKQPKSVIEQRRRDHGVVLIGSRYENFPYTALEAFSFGMPTVATRVGGIPEIVEDGKTGLGVDREDEEAMAKACLSLINDPDLAVRLGAAAFETVEQRYSPSAIAAQTVTFIEKVLSERA